MKRSEIGYGQLNTLALTFVPQRLAGRAACMLKLCSYMAYIHVCVRAPSLQCYAHGLHKLNTTIKVLTWMHVGFVYYFGGSEACKWAQTSTNLSSWKQYFYLRVKQDIIGRLAIGLSWIITTGMLCGMSHERGDQQDFNQYLFYGEIMHKLDTEKTLSTPSILCVYTCVI